MLYPRGLPGGCLKTLRWSWPRRMFIIHTQRSGGPTQGCTEDNAKPTKGPHKARANPQGHSGTQRAHCGAFLDLMAFGAPTSIRLWMWATLGRPCSWEKWLFAAEASPKRADSWRLAVHSWDNKTSLEARSRRHICLLVSMQRAAGSCGEHRGSGEEDAGGSFPAICWATQDFPRGIPKSLMLRVMLAEQMF